MAFGTLFELKKKVILPFMCSQSFTIADSRRTGFFFFFFCGVRVHFCYVWKNSYKLGRKNLVLYYVVYITLCVTFSNKHIQLVGTFLWLPKTVVFSLTHRNPSNLSTILACNTEFLLLKLILFQAVRKKVIFFKFFI